MNKFLTVLSLFVGLTTPAKAIEIKAPQVYLKDLNTGDVLLEKKAEEKMVPSSMSKIITAYLVFERLKSGDTKLDENFQ